MKRIKIFIISVQSEFSEERAMLSQYIRKDALLGKIFETFLFEDVPAWEKMAFPLPENASPTQLLTHLSLMDEKGRLSNSAVLLFGKRPQASAGGGKHVC